MRGEAMRCTAGINSLKMHVWARLFVCACRRVNVKCAATLSGPSGRSSPQREQLILRSSGAKHNTFP